MKPLLILFVFATSVFGTNLYAAEIEDEFPRNGDHFAMIDDIKIVAERVTHRTGLVLDDQGTVYVLSVTGSSQGKLLRISKKGAAKELVLYRGWPYILDHNGRLFALDDSWYGSLSNKFYFMGLRALKTAPIAIGAGLTVYAIGLIDNTFLGILPTRDLQLTTTVLGGMLVYYGVDLTRSIFFRSHRQIGSGGNFFTKLVETGVSSIVPNADFDDYDLEIKGGWGRERRRENLSMLIPRSVAGKSCSEYLTKLSLR